MNEFLDFALKHWQLSSLFFALLAGYLIFEFWQTDAANSVSPEQAVDLYNHKNAVIIDIRTADLFDNGHIVGAMHVDASEPDTKLKKLQKYTDKPIVIVSTDGKAAVKFADRLKKQNFAQVLSLAGGINAWQAAGLPLTKK